jgi:hypothetical protein
MDIGSQGDYPVRSWAARIEICPIHEDRLEFASN